MKKTSILILSIFALVSCETGKVKDLENKIAQLETSNRILKDSIKQIEYNKVSSSYLINIPQQATLKVNEPNKFSVIFFQDVNFPKYDVYEIITDATGQKHRRLIQKGNTKSKFIYEFTPKSKTDNKIELVAQFEKDTIKQETKSITSMSTMSIE
jgi:hypothetical protein